MHLLHLASIFLGAFLSIFVVWFSSSSFSVFLHRFFLVRRGGRVEVCSNCNGGSADGNRGCGAGVGGKANTEKTGSGAAEVLHSWCSVLSSLHQHQRWGEGSDRHLPVCGACGELPASSVPQNTIRWKRELLVCRNDCRYSSLVSSGCNRTSQAFHSPWARRQRNRGNHGWLV